jgi:hypothetical protein
MKDPIILCILQRNKAKVDRNKLREIEEQDERLAKIIQEQEKIKLKKAKQKKKKEQEERGRQQVQMSLILALLHLGTPVLTTHTASNNVHINA